eukprot:2689344-Rhodomonas_salina.1
MLAGQDISFDYMVIATGAHLDMEIAPGLHNLPGIVPGIPCADPHRVQASERTPSVCAPQITLCTRPTSGMSSWQGRTRYGLSAVHVLLRLLLLAALN